MRDGAVFHCTPLTYLHAASASWQAEAIARKNELSFIDLLRPFAQVDTSSVAINTTREQVSSWVSIPAA